MAAKSYSSKSPRPLPSQERLRDLFRYDEETGSLYWRPVSGKSFRDANFNSRFGDKVAGTIGVQGYRAIGIKGAYYKAHRLIWKMHYGTEPRSIDHIDRNPLNNRLENLRESDHKAQMLNRNLFKSNKTGHRHVSIDIQGKKRFKVVIDRKSYGRFYTLEEALVARDAAYQNVR